MIPYALVAAGTFLVVSVWSGAAMVLIDNDVGDLLCDMRVVLVRLLFSPPAASARRAAGAAVAVPRPDGEADDETAAAR